MSTAHTILSRLMTINFVSVSICFGIELDMANIKYDEKETGKVLSKTDTTDCSKHHN